METFKQYYLNEMNRGDTDRISPDTRAEIMHTLTKARQVLRRPPDDDQRLEQLLQSLIDELSSNWNSVKDKRTALKQDITSKYRQVTDMLRANRATVPEDVTVETVQAIEEAIELINYLSNT